MTEPNWVDLESLVDEMYASPTIQREQLTVWGGGFPGVPEQIRAFLKAWALPRAGMPWSLWQWTDRIELQRGASLPGDLEFLERGRVFGKEGDLELRREMRPDGDRMAWRFIGDAATSTPMGLEPDNYWDGKEGAVLRARERSALLWGSREAAENLGKDGWHDDRVGWAKLEYPSVTGERIKICYREYLSGGTVEFVWWLGLKGLHEPCEEDSDE
jgi:hypothetical protein